MRTIVHRRHHRLTRDAYRDQRTVCSITCCVQRRERVFVDPALAEIAVRVIQEHSEKTRVTVHAYCVMPDHVHMTLTPSASCDLSTFVGQVKSIVIRDARPRVVRSFWQESFWDHFLRNDEVIARGVYYVLDNPVRAGLVKRWQDYPYSGSPHVSKERAV